MARYIDADNLIHHDIEDINGDVLDVIHAADIDNAPTVDVAPVRHGRWKELDEEGCYSCSVCGNPWIIIDGTPQDNEMYFCPHCGAKMDEEDKTDV